MSELEGKAGKRTEYVVLARRYRPTQFEEVIGQQHVTKTLQNAIKADRVHHAYLFTGSRGVGKTTVARILARALNHPDGPTPTPPALDRPDADAVDVDVIEIDGASHTGVDDIRELRESVRYLPSHSRHKIYIIDEVHMLSTSAFNALLKTLEEPPPHVVFVFATTEPHKIPATILSRCQRFDFKRVPTDTLVEHAQRLLQQEGLSVDPSGLALIARAAEGGVRDSLSLLDQVIAYTAGQEGEINAQQVAEVLGLADRRTLFALSIAILQRDAGAALAVVDGVFRDGIDLSQFSQAFVAHLRDLIVVASCRDPGPLLEATESELVDLQSQANRVALPLLQQYFDRFAHAAEEIARSNFPRLLLEMVLIELVHTEPLLPLGDLLERLERLESGLPQSTARPAGPSSGSRGGSGPGGGPSRSLARPTGGRPRGDSRAQAPAATPPAAQTASRPSKDAAPRSDRQPTRSESTEPTATVPHPGDGAQSSKSAAPKPTSSGNDAPEGRQLLEVGDRLERWKRLLDRVPGPHTAFFAAGRLIRWEDDLIELGYPPGAFELKFVEDRSRRTTFAERCTEKLGVPVRVEVRSLNAEETASPEMAQISAVQAKEDQRAEKIVSLRNEAEGHPTTRAFVETLGARITRIQTAPEDSN